MTRSEDENSSLWLYSTVHNSHCKIIEEQTLWGQSICDIWLPDQNTVVRVPRSTLRPINTDINPDIEAHRIRYISAAAKVADVLEGNSGTSEEHVLLAPMESNVIPLPHQIQVLSRAISGDQVRYLLADEVGLGKTIEAGLVMRELKLRGLVRRILVVAPKGIATQWVAEMQTHFNEPFQLVLGEDISALQRLTHKDDAHSSPWAMFDQVIVSLDSVKPMDRRRGWSAEKVSDYNRNRFEDLITAGWDLVVVDEAHRMGGSTDQVARYRLGRGLAEAAPYLLLLSATPHQGKTDAFHRLMSLLDSDAFPNLESVSRDRVAPFVIRTEKRKAIDADGKALFKPRRTEMAPVSWERRHLTQQQLYEAVSDYVREGYNQAMEQKKRHVGFLMILMQRLVVSSTRAIRTTLERRLERLERNSIEAEFSQTENTGEQSLVSADVQSWISTEEWEDMDGQQQLEALQNIQAANENEKAEVEVLLDSAQRCEQAGVDAKAEALIEKIYQLQVDENEADLKVLIFTEFVPTQAMLEEFLLARGISVVTLNGSMSMDERKQVQNSFRDQARVLVSTDAGGEGLNLQFCHVIINYDIPWNPMRLEQRIGRVDRIGQSKIVRAINFVFEDSVEFRVLEVLEEKLSVIFDEFGIDKTGDVLDSAEAGALFEDVFATAILNPDGIESSVDQTVARIRDDIREARESSSLYGISEEPDVQAAERLRSHPLPHWIERMTVSYLNGHGGKATRKRSWWDLSWPDGEVQRKCVFNAGDADRLSEATLLNLENKRVRDLVHHLPQITAGQSLPRVRLSELPNSIIGVWGLFEIGLQAGGMMNESSLRIPEFRRHYLSIFLNDEGKVFLPTARHIWDVMQTTELEVLDTLGQEVSNDAFEQLMESAELLGREPFEAMQQQHAESIAREEERGRIAFNARRKAIEHIGLSEVRQYRLAQCETDETTWRNELEAAQQVVPDIRGLLMMKVVGTTDGH